MVLLENNSIDRYDYLGRYWNFLERGDRKEIGFDLIKETQRFVCWLDDGTCCKRKEYTGVVMSQQKKFASTDTYQWISDYRAEMDAITNICGTMGIGGLIIKDPASVICGAYFVRYKYLESLANAEEKDHQLKYQMGDITYGGKDSLGIGEENVTIESYGKSPCPNQGCYSMDGRPWASKRTSYTY
jgi:hypothetical protein